MTLQCFQVSTVCCLVGVGGGGPGFLGRDRGAPWEGALGACSCAWRHDLPRLPSLPEEQVETGLWAYVVCL